MSAIYSIVYSDRVQILTDAGFFDENGVVMAIDRKVYPSPHLPISFAARGRPSEKIASVIYDMDMWKIEQRRNSRDIDIHLAAIGDYFRHLERQGHFEAEFLIAAFSPTLGPCHFLVHCHGRYDFPAFTLFQLGRDVQAGPTVTLDDLVAAGIKPEEIADPGFPVKHGASFMGIARRKPDIVPTTGKLQHVIAGRCDLTTVTAEGCTMQTLCEWPDEIGKPVNPETGYKHHEPAR